MTVYFPVFINPPFLFSVPGIKLRKSSFLLHENHSSNLLENRERRAKIASVILLVDDTVAIDRDLVRGSLGAETPEIGVFVAAFEADHVFLAALRRQAFLAVVVEEGVESRAEDVDVGARDHAEAPRFFAPGCLAVGEVRVVVFGVGGEGRGGVGVRLEVGRFALDGGHVDVLGVDDLVVVQHAVFGAGAVHPYGAFFAFDEDAAAVVDVDLAVVGEVEFVIGHPEPVVLHVYRGLFCHV